MYSSIFTSTSGYEDGHKMIFPWMCRSKTFVLGESDKRGLPCVRLRAGLMYVQHKFIKLTSETEMAEVTASLNCRTGRLAVSGLKDSRLRRLWIVKPPDKIKMPSFLWCDSGVAKDLVLTSCHAPDACDGFPKGPITLWTQ